MKKSNYYYAILWPFLSPSWLSTSLIFYAPAVVELLGQIERNKQKSLSNKFFFCCFSFEKAEWLLKSYTTRINEKGRNETRTCIEYVKSNVDIKYSLQGSPLHNIQYTSHLCCLLPSPCAPSHYFSTSDTQHHKHCQNWPSQFHQDLKAKQVLQGSIVFVPSLLLLIILTQWPDREGA